MAHWNFPRPENIKQEYDVEYQHHMKHSHGDVFPTFDHWHKAIKSGKVTEITPELDRKIRNRSRTGNKKELLSLIKGYASYPKYRNEKTIDQLYDRLKKKQPLDMPLVYKNEKGQMHIVAGNTRMDAAFHSGVNPHAIVFERPKKLKEYRDQDKKGDSVESLRKWVRKKPTVEKTKPKILKAPNGLYGVFVPNQGVKTFKTKDAAKAYIASLKEEIVNAAGHGQVAGIGIGPKGEPGKPGTLMRRQKFGESEVFLVNSEYFHKCRMGKRKYARYEEYVGADEIGEEIRKYGRDPKTFRKPIIVMDERTGAMCYLKYGHGHTLKN